MIREFSAGGLVVRRFKGRPFVAAVRVKKVKELSPRDIEHDNPEFRRHEEMIHFLEQIYGRDVSMDDVVTVVRFSQIVDSPSEMTDRKLGIGGAQN